MSDDPQGLDAVAELGGYERVFLRPRRVDLQQLAADLGYRGDESGDALWARAIAAGRLPSSWAADPQRRFHAPRASQAPALLPAPESAQAALLLASDPAGMLAAEGLARTLVQCFAPWGCPQPTVIEWRLSGNPVDRPAAGGPPLGRLAPAVALLRAVLVGSSGRIYEPPHPHRRMQLVIDALLWRRLWRSMAEVRIPAVVRGPKGPLAVPEALVDRRLGELPDPLGPWLELIRTGYWLWRVLPGEIELAAPFPPPAEARLCALDRRPLPHKRGKPGRAVWSRRLTELRLACARGEPGWVRRGLPGLAADDESGQPRLIHFAVYGGAEVLAVLAEHGHLDLDARDREGRTALMLAAGLPPTGPAGAEKVEIDVPISEIVGAAACEFLLRAGCRRDDRDQRGLTALHWAAVGQRQRSLEVLLRGGVAVDPRDALGRTPLMLAAARGCDEAMLEALLAAGADADARDQQGWTTLHYLATFGGRNRRRRDWAMRLEKAGARPSRDRVGRTPADLLALAGLVHRDGTPLDPSKPVAAGPGPLRRLAIPSEVAATLVEPLLIERVPEPDLRTDLRQRRRPTPDLDRWSVWADWLQTRGDPRGELVAISVAAARTGRHARPTLEAARDRLALALEARCKAGLYAADPFALVRASTFDLEWTHGFVTAARLDEQRLRLAGVHAIPGVLATAAGQLSILEPLLAELHLGVERPESWPIVLDGLRGLEAGVGLRRLGLHRLPRELPALDDLAAVLPKLRSLHLIGTDKLARGRLRWPGLAHLRLRHGGSSEWTHGGVALELDLPDLRVLDLGLPISPRSGEGEDGDREVEGFAELLAHLSPQLQALRLAPVPRRFLEVFLDSGVPRQLTSLILDRVRGQALERLVAGVEVLAGIERVQVSVSTTVHRQRALLLEQLQAALPRLVLMVG